MSILIETVRTGASSMRFFQFGNGKRTFVILPGLSVKSVMEAADAVAEQYGSMTRDFTVFVFDRRTELPDGYSIQGMAEDTAAAFRQLGLGEVWLFGASQGGMLALEMAIRHPGLVRGLALGSTAARVTESRYRLAVARWIELAEKKDAVGLYLDFGRALYPPEVFRQYRDTLAAIGGTVTEEELARFTVLAGAMEGFDVLDELAGIRCPVLAIGSEDDAVLGPEATREIAARLRGRADFQMHMYKDCGHAAFDTAPDYRERILRFFRGTAAW